MPSGKKEISPDTLECPSILENASTSLALTQIYPIEPKTQNNTKKCVQ
jgi:hypothetical protein